VKRQIKIHRKLFQSWTWGSNKRSRRVCSISTSWHFAEKETLLWRQVSECKEFFKVVKLRGSKTFGAFHWNLRKFRLIFRRKKKRASKYRDTRHKRRKDSSRSEDGSTFCRKRQHAPSGLAYTWATDPDPANYDRERPVSPLRDHLCTHFGKLCGHATYILLSGCFRNALMTRVPVWALRHRFLFRLAMLIFLIGRK